MNLDGAHANLFDLWLNYHKIVRLESDSMSRLDRFTHPEHAQPWRG